MVNNGLSKDDPAPVSVSVCAGAVGFAAAVVAVETGAGDAAAAGALVGAVVGAGTGDAAGAHAASTKAIVMLTSASPITGQRSNFRLDNLYLSDNCSSSF